MAKKVFSAIFLYFVCSLFFFSFLSGLSEGQNPLVPALYVFGDSTIDPGNNNGFVTYAKYNYAPYGVDFPGGISGRPTNGHVIADYFAQALGLSLPPAFRSLDLTTYDSTEGFSYASSAAGILPETGSNMFKGVISLGEQLNMFKWTIDQYLTRRFESQDSLKEYLAHSIFFIVIGTNDYGINLLRQERKTNHTIDREAFTRDLIERYKNHLQDLYNMGARKFLLFEIGALGCSPLFANKIFPNNPRCVNVVNAMVSLFNEKLPKMTEDLASRLTGSTFIIGKNYDYMIKIVGSPQNFGLTEVFTPCCVVTSYGTCDAKEPPCTNRNSHMFFDSSHPTEATYKALADRCFNGIGMCVPINLQQLANL